MKTLFIILMALLGLFVWLGALGIYPKAKKETGEPLTREDVDRIKAILETIGDWLMINLIDLSSIFTIVIIALGVILE